jgi:hypothetical protein
LLHCVYIDDIENDINIFVALFTVFGAPFVPESFGTSIHYGIKTLCQMEANNSQTSCNEVVTKWADFGANGYVGSVYSGMGRIRLNFASLPPNIPDVSFTPPIPRILAIPIPPYAVDTPFGPPTFAMNNIAHSLQRVHNVAHLPIGSVAQNVQYMFEIEDHVVRRCRILRTNIV